MKSSILALFAKFTSFNLAAKSSAVILLDSGVGMYLLL